MRSWQECNDCYERISKTHHSFYLMRSWQVNTSSRTPIQFIKLTINFFCWSPRIIMYYQQKLIDDKRKLLIETNNNASIIYEATQRHTISAIHLCHRQWLVQLIITALPVAVASLYTKKQSFLCT